MNENRNGSDFDRKDEYQIKERSPFQLVTHPRRPVVSLFCRFGLQKLPQIVEGLKRAFSDKKIYQERRQGPARVDLQKIINLESLVC